MTDSLCSICYNLQMKLLNIALILIACAGITILIMYFKTKNNSCPKLLPPVPCAPGYKDAWDYDQNGCKVKSRCEPS